MEKKSSEMKRKTSLALRTETLHRLDEPQLRSVAGGGRLLVPVGYADNTATPIYDDADPAG